MRRRVRWAPLAWFVVLSTALTAVVVGLVRPPGPLDSADPADQRDGLLLDGPRLEDRIAGVDFGSRPVVLLFVRQLPAPSALRSWAQALPEGADVRVVLPQHVAPALPLPAVVDRRGRLAEAVGMPTPVDGGRPVGYAVVDSDRVLRYATLDPDYLRNAFEVATIVGAIR